MFRVVFIGETSVGKTSIHLRIDSKKFESQVSPTTGGTFIVHTENCGNSVTTSLQIWDTAGQERFRAITPIYYRDAQAAIVVFAINDRQSFDQVPIWVSDFEKTAGTEAIVFVVANKMDLSESLGEDGVDLVRAEAWATEQGHRFFRTSALEDRGISEFVHELAVEIAFKNLQPKGKVESAIEPEKSRCC
jgi:small GTP-binding protein